MQDAEIAELRKLITQLVDDVDSSSEEEEDALILRIMALSPDPEISDYIFGLEYEGLSVDEIVAKAAAYRPIYL